MSIRPELPYTGSQIKRLTQAQADTQRILNRTKINRSGRELRGYADVTFTASNQSSWATIAIQSPYGNVAGVASSGLIAGVPTFCTVQDNGTGSAVIICWTSNGTNQTGTVRLYYHIWPY